SYVETFLQEAGGFALLGLWIWIIASFARAMAPVSERRRGVPLLILVVAILALSLYAIGGIGGMVSAFLQARQQAKLVVATASAAEAGTTSKWWNLLLDAGGFMALAGVVAP